MSEEEDFDLNELDDKELVEQIQDDLYDGLDAEVTEGTEILLNRGWDANDVLGEALVGGMKIVGVDFRDGILFVPEVLKCAGAMKGGMKILRPILAESAEDTSLCKFVLGTVKGDIHDIGKNLVAMMCEGAGFEVINLGINNPVENYLEAIDEHEPVIVGMSALLTTTMPYMGVVVEEMEKRGMRKDTHIMCGGAPLNQEFADSIGVPAYGRDAARSAEMAEEYVRGMDKKRGHR